jgi:hypothetical protein
MKVKITCKKCSSSIVIDPYSSYEFLRMWKIDHLVEHSEIFLEEII